MSGFLFLFFIHFLFPDNCQDADDYLNDTEESDSDQKDSERLSEINAYGWVSACKNKTNLSWHKFDIIYVADQRAITHNKKAFIYLIFSGLPEKVEKRLVYIYSTLYEN